MEAMNEGVSATKEATISATKDRLIADILERSRQSLLDLSLRNRLLNVPAQSKNARIIHIADELSPEIYRILVTDGKSMSFLPGRESSTKEEQDDKEIAALPQPDEEEAIDERGIAARHCDRRLQTLLTSAGLQKRLLAMYYDARTFEEEQGVNILYLTLGMVKWFEAESSDTERYAPLLLVPVTLERGSAGQRFQLSWRGEEIAANLSLQAKFKAEFGIQLPDLPNDDQLDITAYMHKIAEVVRPHPRFEVRENDITLGFFSFAKFLMYRDLDPKNWPEKASISNHDLITGLLQDGFGAVEGLIDEDAHIDEHIAAAEICHVVDADSSQTLAIEETRRGRNMVIQGPPGTGKSQTIVNIIAAAVAQGKKVLFVAEKMAALEVVYRRLAAIGLDTICLELHSHKANKRQLHEELRRTLALGRPRGHDQGRSVQTVAGLQETLNQHAKMMHSIDPVSELTPFQIIGQLLRLKDAGIQATDIQLDKPEDWSHAVVVQHRRLLEDIAARIQEMGPANQHPWRGVLRTSLLPSEDERLEHMLTTLAEQYLVLMEATGKIEDAFPNEEKALTSWRHARLSADYFLKLPNVKTEILTNPTWLEKPTVISEILEQLTHYQELKADLEEKVLPLVWETDLRECRQHMASYGGSPFSFIHAPYRRAKKLLGSLLRLPLPKAHEEQLALADDILETKRLEKALSEHDGTAKEVFGTYWNGLKTECSQLQQLLSWRESLPESLTNSIFLESCAQTSRSETIQSAFMELEKTLPAFELQWEALQDFLQLDMETAFHSFALQQVNRNLFGTHLRIWIEQREAISKWISLKEQMDRARNDGMSSLIKKISDGNLSPEKLTDTFNRAYFDALAEKTFTEFPALRTFDGERHQQDVSLFRENDLERMEQSKIEVTSTHFNAIPQYQGGTGPLGVLHSELSKKRKHLPIRQLLKMAGPAIQATKPVFMMSPMSIAQFLEPGAVDFDLLVIDEASQVEPVDSLGAIARTKQIVVVGDQKQLPPTRFFSRMTGNEDDDDNESDDYQLATKDVESILSMCLAKGLPQRMLRWHYRSKHQSLIAVSNKEFYENKLFIVPSPYDQASGMGLKFHHLTGATFDSGGTATNKIEARTVAEAVIRHAKKKPNESLGVAAFSTKQRQAIMDELELLRRENPDLEPFFSGMHPDEPFFIKNLENIQGDERDVIFISIGYGRNPQGYMAMRFGPLSADGGERRLNVLISRAKRRCEVFSSITADDIDLERGKGHGVAALKLFLKFAQTGQLDFGRITEREADSVFEEQVAAALRSRGYDVKTQVGIAGFFVDLAISDPDKPGRFLLGVECDGASYHSSRSARERDRLR